MIFGSSKRLRDWMEKEALEHLDSLYATALRMTGQQADAEDLVQDTYLRAIRFCHRFETGTNLKAWLFKMMVNLFINRYRRKRRGREIQEGFERHDLLERVLSPENLAQHTAPEEYFFEKMFSDDVVKAVDELPNDFKIVLLLADVNDFSYAQISEILGIPVGTVMSRLHRGRRMLRGSLYQFAMKEGYIRTDGKKMEQPTSLEDFRERKREVQGIGTKTREN